MFLCDGDCGEGLNLLLVCGWGARVLKLIEELCDDGVQAVGPPGVVHWVRVQDAPGTKAQAGYSSRGYDTIHKLLDDPFQRGDTFMTASGPPGSKASPGLPGSVPMSRLVLSLPSALRVPAIIGLCPRRKRRNLKAIVKDAESKLAVPLWQREQVLVHTLKWLPVLVSGGCGGGRSVFCVPGLFWKLLNEARLAPWADVILWGRQGSVWLSIPALSSLCPRGIGLQGQLAPPTALATLAPC